MKVHSCCKKSGLQSNEMKSVVLGFCFLEATHIQTTAIQCLWTEMGTCAATLFIIFSSEMQRVCRAAIAVPSPKQQAGSASLYWLPAPATDTGRQAIDSLHLPVMAARLMILNTAQEPTAVQKTHTRWTWTSSEPSQCQPLGPSRKLRCPENMTWNNSI